MFQRLEKSAYHHGSVAHITQRAIIDGVNIGHWVMAQRTRHRQGRLAPDRAHALQALPGQGRIRPTTARIHREPASTE